MSEERFKWGKDGFTLPNFRPIYALNDNKSNKNPVAEVYKEKWFRWRYRIYDTGDSGTLNSITKYKAQRLVEVLVRMS